MNFIKHPKAVTKQEFDKFYHLFITRYKPCLAFALTSATRNRAKHGSPLRVCHLASSLHLNLCCCCINVLIRHILLNSEVPCLGNCNRYI
jgi:hypothetical protein